ncbi:MAG: hypothetical protein K6F68_01065 [Clostridiales bacterium]|nr:hypothetical protein [Clostridiales bacterium]
MRKAITILLIIVFIVFSVSCDPRGSLSQKDADNLYAELRNDFKNEGIWNRRIEIIKTASFNQDSVVEFVKQAVDIFLREDFEPTKISAYWFSSRRYCRDCEIYSNEVVTLSEIDYEITEVSIAKYRDGRYQINVFYYICETANTKLWAEIEIR